ncbi:MAG TPA: hypothetical protein VEQ58_23035, partial [Polyangiaceae bacterium]|nr:hypothetical protein [Polyangiaceae bacterium]
LTSEMVMRILDDVSRRVPAGSELVMAFDGQVPMRRQQPLRRSAVLELGLRGPDDRQSVVRYPRLRFVDEKLYPAELGQRLAHVNAAANENAPTLAHFRLV